MGYRGKVAEQEAARFMRACGLRLIDIATELGVAKSSVSLWVRDIEFTASPRRMGAHKRGPNALQRRKAAEIEALLAEGRERIGQLSEREFLVAGAALYAGVGAKGGNAVVFANSDPRLIVMFLAWLRCFFEVDEQRLRLRLYLHEGLDLDSAAEYWAELTGIPPTQHGQPYRAVADPSIRHAKHVNGCLSVRYSCSRTHRGVMGLVHALLTCDVPIPG